MVFSWIVIKDLAISGSKDRFTGDPSGSLNGGRV